MTSDSARAAAEIEAERLFDEMLDLGLLCPGLTEHELIRLGMKYAIKQDRARIVEAATEYLENDVIFYIETLEKIIKGKSNE